jgi:hypothetical protein
MPIVPSPATFYDPEVVNVLERPIIGYRIALAPVTFLYPQQQGVSVKRLTIINCNGCNEIIAFTCCLPVIMPETTIL